MYESKVRGRLIINTTDGGDGGFIKRDYDQFPTGTYATALPLKIIPRSEWIDRIEENDKTDGWPKDHKKLSGFPSLNQGNTNYCWINATTQNVHYIRAMQGLKHVPLSPASVGAKIKNFRNQGGWGSQGLEYIIKHGLVPQSLWPPNAIERRYDTPEADAERKKYSVLEWWELRPGSFDELATCLLLGYPVSVGYNWWSHQVLACQLLVQGGDFLIDIDNSWGDWGDEGHGLLTERKGTPDDAVVARVGTQHI